MRSGYSLMEALVALFILAIATVGLTRATQAHVDSVRGLEQRVIAQWVAENRLTELNLRGGAATSDASVVRMLDRDWDVRVSRSATDDPDLIAVEVAVGPAGSGRETLRLSGFVDRVGSAA
ncbi:type II secretion system minor pseudopilin GspI [Brevundimonas aurifodinae]|uniref:Type II secretion system protein I n=2 Tax=Brevundimonas TaxID=41275 RepID=A0ABV1NPS6_9CAUL|nr:MAG: type II secretion system protein GspI [Brevundimonas sp. 12-68-7]OYX30508.1 MAG: type II secretion system protein GspI [Brevundimonas subvibrioides]